MDELIEKCGSYGRYQKLLLIVIGFVTGLCAVCQYMSVFNNAVPELLCNLRNENQSSNTRLEYLSNGCDAFTNITESLEKNVNSPYECGYDKTYYGETIVTSFDLSCDKLYLASITQTLFMSGATASFISGMLSDIYGRKHVNFCCSIALSLSIILQQMLQLEYFMLSKSVRYFIYLIMQFVFGYTVFSIDVITFVIFLEFSTPRHGNFLSVMVLFMYGNGQLLLLVICFFTRDWRVQNLSASLYAFIASLVIMFFLPESPRFLVVKKRYKEAVAVLTKMAKWNGKNIDEIAIKKEINKITTDENELNKLNESTLLVSRSTLNNKTDKETDNSKNNESIKNYLLNPIRNLVNVIILGYVWSTVSMNYFGITIGITSINDKFNPYLMYLISCFAEIAGYFLSLVGQNLHRKTICIIFLSLTCISSIPVAFIPSNDEFKWDLKTISLIFFVICGKISASACLLIMYRYAILIFPTSVRNTLVSYASCFGRVGAIIAPQVNLLRYIVWKPLPYMVFAVNTLIACILTSFLPNDNIKHNV